MTTVKAPATLRLQSAWSSAVGARESNQDAVDVASGRLDGALVAILSDGAGGHYEGAKAARCAVAAARAALAPDRPIDAAALDAAVQAAHARLQIDQAGRSARQRMHATLVVLAIDGQAAQAHWAHVGDSRLYRWRRGSLIGVTRDDTLVQHLLDAGWIDEDQAGTHPQRHHLLAALGVPQALSAHTGSATLADGDVYLLCSDGWWGALDACAPGETLAASASPQAWLDAMQARIAERADPQQDNYSAVAVWVGDPQAVTRIMA